MKKYIITGFSGIILIYLFILLSGCGGGSSTVMPDSSNPTNTPVINPTALTPTPTVTLAPTATVATISGKITGMFNSTTISGASITVGDKSVLSDSQGNFVVSGATGRMIVSAGNYYTYSFPIEPASSPLSILLVGTEMNNQSYSGYFIRGTSRRWKAVPKIKISEDIPSAQAAAIKNIITGELPGLTGNFISVSENQIISTSSTEPGEGEFLILQDNSATNSYAELSYAGDEIVACKIAYRWTDIDSLNQYSYRTIRHELGHGVGFAHPFEVLGWDSPDLPTSAMNYVNEYNKYSFTYTETDIKVGTRKYHRGAGNKLPDTDPDSSSLKKEPVIKIKL